MKLRAEQLSGGQLSVLLDIGGREPPKEFRIFANGLTETTKGPLVFNAKAGESILARLADLGRDKLNFDYGHGQLGFVQTADTAASAGWFNLEVREDGLWATNIEWTERAAKALSAREFRYFSPAVLLDAESNEVRELINIALTNIPATKHQVPLVASQHTPGDGPTQHEVSMDSELAKLLGAFGVQNPSQAVAKLDSLKSNEAKLVEAVKETQTKLSAVEAELATFKNERANAEKAEFVAKLCADGKLPPALKDWALGQSIETMKSFGDAAPVVPVADKAEKTTPRTPNAGLTVLSDEDKKVARMLGVSEADFLDTRKLQADNFWQCDPEAGDAQKESK